MDYNTYSASEIRSNVTTTILLQQIGTSKYKKCIDWLQVNVNTFYNTRFW